MDRILEAAARIFHEQGYSGATTNDIADEAGVAIGSLYQYFPNKDALLVELANRHIESTERGLTDLLSKLPTDPGIEPVLRAVVKFLVAQHEMDDLHLLVMHHAPRTKEINLRLENARSRLVEVASSILTDRVHDGQRRDLVARMVVATIDASVHDVILRRPRGVPRDAAIELTVSTALSIIDSG